MQSGIADAGVTERIKDGQGKRRANQQQDVQDRRAEHGGAQERTLGGSSGLYLAPFHEWLCARCRERNGLRLGFFRHWVIYCHARALGSTRFSLLRSKNFNSRSETAKS